MADLWRSVPDCHDEALGWPVNSKRVRRWMKELGLAGALPVRKTRATESRHSWPGYPNLVKELNIQRPKQVWVADITYIRLKQEFVYLAVIMDVFTRSIRGWHLGRNLDSGLTRAALEQALAIGTPEIHRSDQGVQYAAAEYTERLTTLHVQPGMAPIGEPAENG